MKKECIKYLAFLALLLLVAVIISGCKKSNIPNRDTFSKEIKVEYPEIKGIQPYVYNTPDISIYVRGEDIDNEVKEKIAVKAVKFILSDEGYKEMVQYYINNHRMNSSGFLDIYISFIDTEYDADKERIRYYSRRNSDIAEDDIENRRGFVEWKRVDFEHAIYEKVDIFNME